MAEMMDLYNEAENSVLGTIADAPNKLCSRQYGPVPSPESRWVAAAM